jgi:peptidoglycan/xylan/chitin deacetylase (PgdA/CDA1 family)
VSTFSEVLRPDGVAIFLFHGVVRKHADRVRNYTGKHVQLDEFVALLTSLRSAGAPVSMPQVAAYCAGATDLPPQAFAITFDDGFANNHSVAAPALAELAVPAMFYVTGDFVDQGGASWIDLIEAAVEYADDFAVTLPFDHPHLLYRTRAEKIELLNAIRERVKSDPAIDPYELADDVRRQLQAVALAPDPDLDAKLTWDDVRELSQHDLFTIGGHGMTHRILEHLPNDELEVEVGRNLAQLRAHIDDPVEHFSYPEGLAHCFSDRVIATLRAHGVRCAVTALPGSNKPGDDLFRLRRYLVA